MVLYDVGVAFISYDVSFKYFHTFFIFYPCELPDGVSIHHIILVGCQRVYELIWRNEMLATVHTVVAVQPLFILLVPPTLNLEYYLSRYSDLLQTHNFLFYRTSAVCDSSPFHLCHTKHEFPHTFFAH